MAAYIFPAHLMSKLTPNPDVQSLAEGLTHMDLLLPKKSVSPRSGKTRMAERSASLANPSDVLRPRSRTSVSASNTSASHVSAAHAAHHVSAEQVTAKAGRNSNVSKSQVTSEYSDQLWFEKFLGNAIKRGRLRTMVVVCSTLYLSLIGIIAYLLTR